MLTPKEIQYVQRIESDLSDLKKHNKISIEKLASTFGISDKNLVKELTELAIVNVARRFAHEPGTIKEQFEKITELYNHQVNLSHRTSQSILLQQYSTPAPIGFLAGIYCGIQNFNDKQFLFEPSAGNGLLTIAISKPSQAVVNEVDSTRRNNLKTQGYYQVFDADATGDFETGNYSQFFNHVKFDAVITNPPFGTLDVSIMFDTFPIKTLDHLMALRALEMMKDTGKAAIIIGGHTKWDEKGRIQSGKNRIFFNYLYHHYYVDDVINIDGHKLYSRQGTAFDVRLILIKGRKEKPSGVAPLRDKSYDIEISTFDELYDRVISFTDTKKKKEKNLFNEKYLPQNDTTLFKLFCRATILTDKNSKENINGWTVLSAFDGLSAAQIALKRAGINVKKYYASETDKYAIEITQRNFPNTIQLGDVKNVKAKNLPKIDLLIGGSPCQDLSIAKNHRQGLSGNRSGLFWEYVRLLKECNPKYFLLENVASMPDKDKNIITKTLKVEPVLINSGLVSAQHRKRYYWTNIPNLSQPTDKKILLKDIVEYGFSNSDKSLAICDNYFKSRTLKNDLKKHLAISFGQVMLDTPKYICNFNPSGKGQGGRIYSTNAKAPAICAGHEGGGSIAGITEARTEKAKQIRKEHKQKYGRDYSPRREKILQARTDNKSGCLLTTPIKNNLLFDGYRVRKLTPIECERLQTIPDNYTKGVSNTQRFKMLGNSFTVDVIVHLLKHVA